MLVVASMVAAAPGSKQELTSAETTANPNAVKMFIGKFNISWMDMF